MSAETLQERVAEEIGPGFMALTNSTWLYDRGADVAEIACKALGLDPSMSVAELQSYIAIGRKVMAEKPVRGMDHPRYTEIWAITADAWADGHNGLLASLRAAGGVEQQGSEL